MFWGVPRDKVPNYECCSRYNVGWDKYYKQMHVCIVFEILLDKWTRQCMEQRFLCTEHDAPIFLEVLIFIYVHLYVCIYIYIEIGKEKMMKQDRKLIYRLANGSKCMKCVRLFRYSLLKMVYLLHTEKSKSVVQILKWRAITVWKKNLGYVSWSYHTCEHSGESSVLQFSHFYVILY